MVYLAMIYLDSEICVYDPATKTWMVEYSDILLCDSRMTGIAQKAAFWSVFKEETSINLWNHASKEHCIFGFAGLLTSEMTIEGAIYEVGAHSATDDRKKDSKLVVWDEPMPQPGDTLKQLVNRVIPGMVAKSLL